MRKIYEFLKTIHDKYTNLELTIALFINKYETIVYYNIFSFSVIGFIFYTRLFIERWPRDLSLFHSSLLICSIFILIVQSVSLRKFFNQLKPFDEKREEAKLKRLEDFLAQDKLFVHIIHYFLRTSLQFYTDIQDHYKELLSRLLSNFFFMKNFYNFGTLLQNVVSPKMLYYSLFLLPRLILISIFFIEVIFFHQIIFYYKFLWLYLLPLFGRILRFTYTNTMTDRREFFNACLVIVSETEQSSTEPYKEEIFSKFVWLHPNDTFNQEALNAFKIEYLITRRLYHDFNLLYTLDESAFNLWVKIVFSFFTIIPWVYIIYLSLWFFPVFAEPFFHVIKFLFFCLLLTFGIAFYSLLLIMYFFDMKPNIIFSDEQDSLSYSTFSCFLLQSEAIQRLTNKIMIFFINIPDFYIKYFFFKFVLNLLQICCLIMFCYKLENIFGILFIFFITVNYLLELILNIIYKVTTSLLEQDITEINTEEILIDTNHLTNKYESIFINGEIKTFEEALNEGVHYHFFIDAYERKQQSFLNHYQKIFSICIYIIYIYSIFI